MTARTLTAEFCGDPAPGRSALDGWQPRGEPSFRDLEHHRELQKQRDKKRPARHGKRKRGAQ